MEIIGNFFGVEHDGSVEVGEENDEDKIDGWIEEPFGGDTVGIERAEIAGGRSGEKRNQGRAKAVFWVEGEDKLADEGGEGEEGGSEDDRNDAGGDELDGEDGTDAAIGRVAVDAFGVVDGDDALGFVDFDEKIDDGK